MEELSTLKSVWDIIVGFALFIGFISVLAMSDKVYQIRKYLKRIIIPTLEKSLSDKTHDCIHCGFQSNNPFDFYPVCERNVQGKTLVELKARYNEEKGSSEF